MAGAIRPAADGKIAAVWETLQDFRPFSFWKVVHLVFVSQRSRQGCQQYLGRKRLRQDSVYLQSFDLGGGRDIHHSAHCNKFDIAIDVSDRSYRPNSVEERHRHIGEHQCDLTFVSGKRGNCVGSVYGSYDAITVSFKSRLSDRPDVFFVINNENQLPRFVVMSAERPE